MVLGRGPWPRAGRAPPEPAGRSGQQAGGGTVGRGTFREGCSFRGALESSTEESSKARGGAVGMDRGGLTGVLTGKAGAWGHGRSSWGPWLAALPREAEGPGGREGEIGFGQAGLDPPGRQRGEGPGGGGLRLRDEERCSGPKSGSRSPSGATPRQRWQPSLRGRVRSCCPPLGPRAGRSALVPSRPSVQPPAASSQAHDAGRPDARPAGEHSLAPVASRCWAAGHGEGMGGGEPRSSRLPSGLQGVPDPRGLPRGQ